MPSVAIVDYGSGNLRSAAKAFERAARETGSGHDIVVSGDPRVVERAERIVLPGVGAFADCRAGLYAVPGMVEILQRAVIERGRPFLGICVGMQLMATRGVEYGTHPGLDWIKGEVVRLTPADRVLKIPHMGWNELVDLAAGHPLLAGIAPGDHAYFVHSYELRAEQAGTVLARTDYGGRLTAMVGRDNLAGTQFHPEKSQRTGLTLIANFLRWQP
ncbi:MAG: imidazole glycerol phosphate synthase subunit HisH [Alphaproteobacteria bacterium]|nr:imidazole glycerol phosphate synthase subunit HisH [Alphaproteobacteria bacterium]MCW5743343.1 imidazole glycerol phosphate synthase subunit HisH [Alphaproteobacteria bacterium]